MSRCRAMSFLNLCTHTMAERLTRVWSGLVWSGQARSDLAKCWPKHHSSGLSQLVYWHENLSKMHHAFIFIIRKHKNNVLDIWPGPNDNVWPHVATSFRLIMKRLSVCLSLCLFACIGCFVGLSVCPPSGSQPGIVFGLFGVSVYFAF